MNSLFDEADATSPVPEPLVLSFRQTADPWHDWGLCELYDVLQNLASQEEYRDLLQIGEPEASGFSVTAQMSAADFARALHGEMASNARWNALHPRFEEGKKIPGCESKIVDGRRVPDSSDKNDAAWVKQNWASSGCKGEPPKLGRNKCQRITNVPLTPTVLAALLNREGGAKSVEALAQAALAGKSSDLKQETNPLAANHHSNGKVRGPHASNAARVESGNYVLACYAASLSPWKPFVTIKASNCTVYLPDNIVFDRAWRLWKKLHDEALRHPDDAAGTMYRNLPLSGDGEDAQILMLLDALLSKLPVVRSSDELDEDDITELNNWLAISFSSGTGVSVGSVHRIEVPGEVFDLLRPIAPPAHWKDVSQVAFARDCLAGIRVSDATPQNYFARALLSPARHARWQALENAAHFLFKNTNRANTTKRSSAALLPHFMLQFAREMNIMQEDQMNACRKIGELAGQAFSRDVTMISRLHNASSPDQLRENLALLSFRLFKASNDPERRAAIYHISAQEFERVLAMTHSDEWSKAAQTISLFACLKAFNQNLENKSDSKNSGSAAGGTS